MAYGIPSLRSQPFLYHRVLTRQKGFRRPPLRTRSSHANRNGISYYSARRRTSAPPPQSDTVSEFSPSKYNYCSPGRGVVFISRLDFVWTLDYHYRDQASTVDEAIALGRRIRNSLYTADILWPIDFPNFVGQ